MMIYALIKAGTIVNTIIADPVFKATIEADYDGVVRIDDLGDVRPGVYWTYDGTTFTPGFPPADPEEIKP